MAFEIRQNKATGEWVIFATSRAQRPHDFALHDFTPKNHAQDKRMEAIPDWDENCPFCPGNELKLAHILLETPASGSGKWQTRVVENKYPALTPEGDNARHASGIYQYITGYGRHEVIIESPVHNRSIGTMPADEVRAVVETYYRRYTDLMKDRGNSMAILFRNHGVLSGNSLMHPHSQIIITGIVPGYIRRREAAALEYYDESGNCVFCDIAEYESKDRRRVILENEAFIAFVPYAAEVPFEIWIVPKRHQSDFGSVTQQEMIFLSAILNESLARLHDRLNNPDYNYVFNTAAHHSSGEGHLHWHVQIQPRLTVRAGFEIGSGIRINPVFPEDNADFLK